MSWSSWSSWSKALAACGLAASLSLVGVVGANGLPQPEPPAPAPLADMAGEPGMGDLLGQPLAFVASGRAPGAQAGFTARGPGYEVQVAATGAEVTLLGGDRPAVVHVAPVGAQAPAAIRALDELPGRFNDLRGADPHRWRTDLPTYARVSLEEVYPGVDLTYYGNQRRLEYDFMVGPGADPGLIHLAFGGSEPPALAPDGSLLLSTPAGILRQLPPLAYQESAGERDIVASGYVVSGDRVSFRLAAYDTTRPLVIDPILSYSTYLGGSGADKGFAVAVDGDATYVAGQTSSADFPTTPGLDATLGNTSDAFVTKLGADGAIEYSTFLGGNRDDQALGLAVMAGQAYVTGQTLSTNFPTTAGLDSALAGGADAFVTKLDAQGALAYSSYLGGAGDDIGHGVAVDVDGKAHVAGETRSSDFPTTPGRDVALGGNADAFVTKLSAAGVVDYSTYLGGADQDQGFGVALDAKRRAYVTGQTFSSDFPTTPGLDTILGGPSDAFVTKLSVAGGVELSTYLGGGDHDQGFGIAVDSKRRAHVTGQTLSSDFPATLGLDTTLDGVSDAFVAKLSSAAALEYSTYLGGTSSDQGIAIALDARGLAHVTGQTLSSDFPTKGGPDASLDGPSDAFVTKLKAPGTLAYSTFLGGAIGELGVGIAVDATGAAFVTGQTSSADYPTTEGLDQTFGGGIIDSFVTKLSP